MLHVPARSFAETGFPTLRGIRTRNRQTTHENTKLTIDTNLVIRASRRAQGFAKFVVEPYLGFLPHDEPLSFVTWTYLAAGAELAGAAGLTLGLWTRLSALSLFSTMGLAVYFHVAQSGLEGFPLGVVEKHQYAYEPAALYCLIYFYFLCNGGGGLSLDNALKKKD